MRISSPGRAAPPLKPIALAVALALAAPHAALGAPVGHTVVAGDVTVTQPNAQTMVINQGTDKAILNWRGFSIGAGEKVQFVQPGSGSVALNRVTGGAPSEIFGRLEANGKVFLVNPAGVMFGRGASVDVGGLVASTLAIGDDDFLAGRYAFADAGGAGTVSNEGRLAAAGRGTIALLGAQVSNSGTVTARLGTVGLAAGGKVTLDFNGDGLTRIVVDAARINALVENGGAIIADGGQVTMTARAVGAIADTVVRQQGLVQATGLVERNGRILLDGGAVGKVELAGRIDASGRAPGQRGGDVTLLGRDIVLAARADIDASGDAGGGTVLVGGDYQGANPLVPHAASTTMAAGASIRADALGLGAGGKVVLWSDGHTSAHGSASATGGAQGGNGGMVETSGHTLDVAGMRVKAGAARGAAGDWLLDPGDIFIDSDLAASIADALNNSTNVTVSTAGADSEGPGDIYVAASIEKTAGGDVSLRLDADNDIRFEDSVQIASLGAAGKLNVDLNADADGSGAGAVALGPESALLSNGGDVRIYGQGDPDNGRARGSESLYEGVLLEGALIDSRRGQSDAGAGGRIAIAGAGEPYTDPFEARPESAGVRINNSTLLSSTGDITIRGTGATYSPDGEQSPRDARGVVVSLEGGARIASTTGALTLGGNAGNAAEDGASVAGLDIHVGPGSSITAAGGNLRFEGSGNSRGAGVGLSAIDATISAGGRIDMVGSGGVRVALDNSTLASNGALSVTGAANSGADVDGIALSMVRGARIQAGTGGVELTGIAGNTGHGIAIAMDDARINAAGPVSLVGTGGLFGDGVQLNLFAASIETTGALSIDGTGGRGYDGAVVDLAGSSLRGASIDISGTAGLDGTGVSSILSGATIAATSGGLTIDGSGSGASDGVRMFMSESDLGSSQGNVDIVGTGGDLGGRGVVISSLDEEMGTDGSAGGSGVMASSSARLHADHGDVRVAGVNGSGGVSESSAVTEADASHTAGVELTGIELRALEGDVLIAGAGVPDADLVATGVVLTNVLATTDGAAGNVRIFGVALSDAPGMSFDGVSLGGAAMNGNIVITGRNAGAGPVFSYPGSSQWANNVQTSGVINLRPDDGGEDYAGVPALAVPIMVGAGANSGFGVKFSDLGIGHLAPANVVIGSSEHTGQITWLDANPFAGNLTLQNGGAGSQGIVLASSLNASGLVTLASGGAVSASGSVIDADGLLLHGARPEASFALGGAAHSVDRFAANFNGAANTASTAYGDVSFRNSGPLAVTALAGKGFTTAAGQVTDIAAPTTVVSGDLLLRTPGTLTLEQGVSTLGGDITLVTDSVLRSGGHTLAPGGGGTWRVFADTWVGEDRSGLTPSLPHPNYYNCAYGATCAEAIAGNRFIYRAQPTLTLTPAILARGYGSANPALTFSPTGLVNGDTLADALSGGYTTTAQQFSSLGAYPVTGSFSSPVGYAIDARSGTLTVNRAALLISVDDKNKVYGAADPLLTASISGLVADDSAAVVTGLTLTAPQGAAASAGSHAIIGANAAATNYDINYQQGTLTVAKAPLAVLPNNQTKVYGDADPVLTTAFSGFQYADSAAVVSGLTLATATGAAASAGSHAITASGGTAANYTLSYQPGTLTVARAPLAVLALNQSKVYGDADPLLTAGFSGLKYADSGAVVSGLTLATATGAAATAGAHVITVSGGTAANYTLSYQPGTLSVAKAPLLVAADNKSKVYGAPDPALSATLSGFRYADTAAVVAGLVLSAPTGAAAGAGNHPIVAQGGAAANYALNYQPGVLVVDPAVLFYVADSTRQLQGAAQPIAGSVTGFVYDDTLASATSGTLQFVSLSPTLGPAGVYAVEGRGLTAANYRFVQAPSNATALTLFPMVVDDRPTIARDITFESSNVYEKNFGSPKLCVGAGPLGSGAGGSESNDLLALEWSRVRVSPNLSNCLGLGQRNGCQDF